MVATIVYLPSLTRSSNLSWGHEDGRGLAGRPRQNRRRQRNRPASTSISRALAPMHSVDNLHRRAFLGTRAIGVFRFIVGL